MVEKIHIMISLFAAIVVAILSLIRGMDPVFIALRLIFVIIIFYFIGLIVRRYLKKVVFVKNDNKNDNDIDTEDSLSA